MGAPLDPSVLHRVLAELPDGEFTTEDLWRASRHCGHPSADWLIRKLRTQGLIVESRRPHPQFIVWKRTAAVVPPPLPELTPESRERLTPLEREQWQMVLLRRWLAVRCPPADGRARDVAGRE